MFGYLNSSSFSPLSYLGRAQAARLRVRFTAHNADESPLPIQLIIFPLIIFGSGADRKAARPIHRSQCGRKSASHTAHHFPPYHIWVGRRTARLCVRFLFPRFFSPPRRKKDPPERAGKFPRFFSPPRAEKKDPPERAGKFPRFFSPPRRKKDPPERAGKKGRLFCERGAPLIFRRFGMFQLFGIFQRFGIFQLSCDISSVCRCFSGLVIFQLSAGEEKTSCANLTLAFASLQYRSAPIFFA